MSQISDRSLFEAFVSTGKDRSKAFPNQRLIKVIYKSRGDKEAAKPNVCASVPLVPNEWITDNVSALLPYIRNLVENAQDAIARERYEAGAASIGHEEIDIASVIAYLDDDSKSGRMTGDDIRAWFASELQDAIMVAMADKLGVGDTPSEDQTKRIEQAVNVYRDKFASLAGGKTSLSEQVIEKLQTVMVLGDSENPVSQRLAKRLEDMKAAHKDELMAL